MIGVHCFRFGHTPADRGVRAAAHAEEGLPGELSELTERELEMLRLVARNDERRDRNVALPQRSDRKEPVGHVLQKLGLRDRIKPSYARTNADSCDLAPDLWLDILQMHCLRLSNAEIAMS